jgi:hypothetical protein
MISHSLTASSNVSPPDYGLLVICVLCFLSVFFAVYLTVTVTVTHVKYNSNKKANNNFVLSMKNHNSQNTTRFNNNNDDESDFDVPPEGFLLLNVL